MADQKYKVAIIRCSSYDRDDVYSAITHAIELLGGIDQFIKPNQTVLVKPNLLSPSSREKRVVTDPEVIRAICDMALKAKAGKVLVGDSPGTVKAMNVMQKCGMSQILVGIDVEAVELDEQIEVKGEHFPKIILVKTVFDVDLLINAAKAKTHAQTGLTLCAKNLFGCVPGLLKGQWHLRAGRDVHHFARLLVEIAQIINPRLNILDAIIGMEGNGPGSGDERKFNAIIVGSNCFAVDIVASTMLGYPLYELPIHVAAREMGVSPNSIDEIELVGDSLNEFMISDLRRAVTKTPRMLPDLLFPFARQHATPRPIIDDTICTGCGTCVDACPANAMSQKEVNNRKTSPTIDRDTCICCFCCQEICPVGAIEAREGFLSRLTFRRKIKPD